MSLSELVLGFWEKLNSVTMCWFMPLWQRKLARGPLNIHSMSKSVYPTDSPNKLNLDIVNTMGIDLTLLMQNYDSAINASFTACLFFVVDTFTFVWVAAVVAFDSCRFDSCGEVWNDIQITTYDSGPLHDFCVNAILAL